MEGNRIGRRGVKRGVKIVTQVKLKNLNFTFMN